MPSMLHEALLTLFRNRPELAPELLSGILGVELPAYTEVRIDSAELTDVLPAEYRADLVVLLVDGMPVLGIVVEVQLDKKERKRFTWPVYATGLRARLQCDACVLVVTANDAVAAWAAEPIAIGGGSVFKPLVIGPRGVPIIRDIEQARGAPELAVLAPRLHYENGLLSVEGGFDVERIAPLLEAFPEHHLWQERNLFFGGAHTVRLGPRGADGMGDPRRAGVFRQVPA